MSELAESDGRMSGPNGGVRPVPDPTVLTSEAIERAVSAERERTDGQLAIRDEKLAGIDEATKLLRSDRTEIPRIIDEKVGHLAELTTEQFASIKDKLATAEAQRLEQKQDSKESLDAALTAAKEAVAEQNSSNTLAIAKTETTQTEAIKKLESLVDTRLASLSDKIDDLKGRMDRFEAGKQGASETRTEGRAQISSTNALIGTGLAVIAAAGIYFGTREPAIVNPTPTPTPTQTVTAPATP